ncbi:MAG TPA: hypothetical protein P5534_12385 [Candidatus Paceibacterota bacterium]|nr:hypothetical protein [Candidatus Paceibacterota bacterium]HRZ54919.1 hypothetical protein [Candidatus Paceibacterota bacterium]
MKPEPVRQGRRPGYPTRLQVLSDPSLLLNHIPSNWTRIPALGSAVGLFLGINLNEVPAVLCRYEQMLLPIADRVGRRLYREHNPLFLHKHYNAAYPVLSVIEDGGRIVPEGPRSKSRDVRTRTPGS